MIKKSCFLIVFEKIHDIVLKETLFRDVLKQNDVYLYNEEELTSKWKQLLISKKGQKLTHGKLNWFLKKDYHWLNDIDKYCELYECVNVFFVDSSLVFHRPPAELMLEKKSKWDNLHYILFYWDVISRKISSYSNYLRSKGVFDLIYTFDEQDAKNYGLIHWNTPYSDINLPTDDEEIRWDLYYCGKVKDAERAEELLQILKASSGQADLYMDLSAGLEKDMEFTKDYPEKISVLKYGDYLPYTEVVQRTIKSNCILDICLKEQRGMSLRPYEAVVHNKKLLTTNPEIVHFKFYDERYMKYYHSVEDIDWKWVSKRETIDYGYNGEFSPVYLFENIEKRLTY